MEPRLEELFRITGQTAIITGAAKGIGRGIALRLAEAGAAVVVSDVDIEAAEGTAQQIRAAGGKAQAVRADVSRPADGIRLVEAAQDSYGRVDILVNNAGVFPMAPVMAVTEELWDRVLAVNLKGVFFTSQAAVKMMTKNTRGGSIVNISSIDSLHPTGALAHYDASKAGVVMLTRSMALELAVHAIRVNAISPGAIRTPGAEAAMAKGMPGKPTDEVFSSFAARIPLKRVGAPDDIARATVFLASRAADYITGVNLVVDGGWLLS